MGISLENELKPIVLSGEEVNWEGIFSLAFKNEGMYLEVRYYEPEKERYTIEFFMRAVREKGDFFLEFQEFNSEAVRRLFKEKFKNEVIDIEPRGIRVMPKVRQST